VYDVGVLHIRKIAPMLIAVLALRAEAGITYRFSTKSTAALQSNTGGRVWMDGDRKRVELDPDPSNPRTFDVSISANGKTTFVNVQNKTYFHEKERPKEGMMGGSSMLFHLPWPNDRIKGRPKITYRAEGTGPSVGEHATTKHRIQFAYRVRGEAQGVSLHGEVNATVSVLVAPALSRGADSVVVRSGFREVDDEVQRLLSSLEGMVVGSEVSVSRRLEGGPTVTETTTVSIDELQAVDVDASIFAIPPGFTYQEPRYGVPGL
jgi:hypothetical protein